MSKEVVIYKKVKTFFRGLQYNNKYKRDDVCPLCNKQIIKGDNLYLLINNYKLFPNIFVHQSCVTTKKDCIIKLAKNYKEYKNFEKKYNYWIKRIYSDC